MGCILSVFSSSVFYREDNSYISIKKSCFLFVSQFCYQYTFLRKNFFTNNYSQKKKTLSINKTLQ